jgi:hypothetical protein
MESIFLVSNRMFSGMAGFELDQPAFMDELASSNVLNWHPALPSSLQEE